MQDNRKEYTRPPVLLSQVSSSGQVPTSGASNIGTTSIVEAGTTHAGRLRAESNSSDSQNPANKTPIAAQFPQHMQLQQSFPPSAFHQQIKYRSSIPAASTPTQPHVTASDDPTSTHLHTHTHAHTPSLPTYSMSSGSSRPPSASILDPSQTQSNTHSTATFPPAWLSPSAAASSTTVQAALQYQDSMGTMAQMTLPVQPPPLTQSSSDPTALMTMSSRSATFLKTNTPSPEGSGSNGDSSGSSGGKTQAGGNQLQNTSNFALARSASASQQHSQQYHQHHAGIPTFSYHNSQVQGIQPPFVPGQTHSASDPGHYGLTGGYTLSQDGHNTTSHSDVGHGQMHMYTSHQLLSQPQPQQLPANLSSMSSYSDLRWERTDPRTPTAFQFSQTAMHQQPQQQQQQQHHLSSGQNIGLSALSYPHTSRLQEMVADAEGGFESGMADSPSSSHGEDGHGHTQMYYNRSNSASAFQGPGDVSAGDSSQKGNRLSLYTGSESGWSLDSYASSSQDHEQDQLLDSQYEESFLDMDTSVAAYEGQPNSAPAFGLVGDSSSGNQTMPGSAPAGSKSGRRGKKGSILDTTDNKDLKRIRNRESSQRFRDRVREKAHDTKRRMDYLENRVRYLERELQQTRATGGVKKDAPAGFTEAASGEVGKLVPISLTAMGGNMDSVPLTPVGKTPTSASIVTNLESLVSALRMENESLRQNLKSAEDEIEKLSRQGVASSKVQRGPKQLVDGASTGTHSRMTSYSSVASGADSSVGGPSGTSGSLHGSQQSTSSTSVSASASTGLSHAAQVFRARSSSLASNITSASSSAQSMTSSTFGKSGEAPPPLPGTRNFGRITAPFPAVQQYQIEQSPAISSGFSTSATDMYFSNMSLASAGTAATSTWNPQHASHAQQQQQQQQTQSAGFHSQSAVMPVVPTMPLMPTLPATSAAPYFGSVSRAPQTHGGSVQPGQLSAPATRSQNILSPWQRSAPLPNQKSYTGQQQQAAENVFLVHPGNVTVQSAGLSAPALPSYASNETNTLQQRTHSREGGAANVQHDHSTSSMDLSSEDTEQQMGHAL